MQPPVRYYPVLAHILTSHGIQLYRTAVISSRYPFCAKEFPKEVAVCRFLLEYEGPTFKREPDNVVPKSPDSHQQALNWLASRGRKIRRKVEPHVVQINMDLGNVSVYASNPYE